MIVLERNTTIQKFGVGNNFYMFVYLFDHIVETENISNIIIIESHFLNFKIFFYIIYYCNDITPVVSVT